MPETTTDKERAKRLLVELVREAGGTFHNKTNLNKAFWRAHLHFAKEHGQHLSHWPIVKLPRGPAADDLDVLIGELLTDGALHIEQRNYGEGRDGFVFILTDKAPSDDLSGQELEAVRQGVDAVDGKSAATVTNESHEDSRAWKAVGKIGEEMNVFLDVSSDEEYAERIERAESIASSLDKAFLR